MTEARSRPGVTADHGKVSERFVGMFAACSRSDHRGLDFAISPSQSRRRSEAEAPDEVDTSRLILTSWRSQGPNIVLCRNTRLAILFLSDNPKAYRQFALSGGSCRFPAALCAIGQFRIATQTTDSLKLNYPRVECLLRASAEPPSGIGDIMNVDLHRRARA
jgi:hypothetical protein